MTTAPQLAVGTTTQVIDDTSFSVFQQINAPQLTELVCGNIFLGLQGYVAVVVPLGESLGLTRGATIETSLTDASLSFRATRNWAAGGQLLVNCMVDDNPRGQQLDPRLAWKPPGGFGPSWRHDSWGTFRTRLEDTGGSPFLDVGTSANAAWPLRQTVGERERLASTFTVAGGPWSVARAILELQRTGSPSGSMEVAIQGSQSNGFGSQEPDGVDLAVSATVTNATIPTTPTLTTFAFSPDVVLSDGVQYWCVLRPSVAYPVNGTDYVSWRQNRAFFNVGGAHYAPNAVRLSRGLYPGHVDVSLDTAAKEVGTPITWNVPARSIGQTVSTPDLSPLVQEVCLTSGHETASALCFTVRASGQTITYGFAAHGHPTLDPPAFACQFRRRDVRGGTA